MQKATSVNFNGKLNEKEKKDINFIFDKLSDPVASNELLISIINPDQVKDQEIIEIKKKLENPKFLSQTYKVLKKAIEKEINFAEENNTSNEQLKVLKDLNSAGDFLEQALEQKYALTPDSHTNITFTSKKEFVENTGLFARGAGKVIGVGLPVICVIASLVNPALIPVLGPLTVKAAAIGRGIEKGGEKLEKMSEDIKD